MVVQILHPPEYIHKPHFIIISHCIDRKISALQVLFQTACEPYFFGMPAVFVCPVYPVSCHFKGILPDKDCNCSMFDPCIHSPAKKFLNFFRTGRCSDIPVLRSSRQDRIPHASADRKRLIPVELEVINNHHHFPWQCYFHE